MFLRLIFRKQGIKENKIILAIVYGGLYAAFTFLIFLFSSIIIKRFYLTRYLLVSIFVGIGMFIVYLIKWEFISLKKIKS